MKEKYIADKFPHWMEFGIHPTGEIDIAAGSSGVDIAVKVPRQIADQVMAAHNQFREEYIRLINAFEAAAPEAFKKYWYES